MTSSGGTTRRSGVGVARLNPPTMRDSTVVGHSQISVAGPGRLAFVSGQIAWRSAGGPLPDDLTAQTNLVAESLRRALEALDAGPRDIAMVRLYVVDGTRERFEAVWPTLLSLFDGAMPSATVLGVTGLAAPGLQVEVEMAVHVP